MAEHVVFKYPIEEPRFSNFIEMPKGARLLKAKVQHGVICIWALVNPKAVTLTREISVAATGERFDAEGAYHLNTVFFEDGDLVYHVFDCGYTPIPV